MPTLDRMSILTSMMTAQAITNETISSMATTLAEQTISKGRQEGVVDMRSLIPCALECN